MYFIFFRFFFTFMYSMSRIFFQSTANPHGLLIDRFGEIKLKKKNLQKLLNWTYKMSYYRVQFENMEKPQVTQN